ncbi:MAG: enoyl-CoA hydratase/isomerase family protein [Chloroflexota bacterium]
MDDIVIVTMNRPERHNAMGTEGGKELQDALQTAEDDERVRAVILTGAGERAFSVGADLKDSAVHASESAAESLSMFLSWADSTVDRMKTPIIAAVNGFCVGGGLEQALACDIIICSDNATFWLPQTGLGLFPGTGCPRLARAVGRSMAMEIVLTGRRVSAEEALRIRLVNRVVPLPELRATAVDMAKSIAKNSPLGVMFGKQSIRRNDELFLSDALAEDGMRLFPLYGTDDRKEASAAFLEKRAPAFQGR